MRTFYKDKALLSINPVFNLEFLDTCQDQPLYTFTRKSKNRQQTQQQVRARSNKSSRSLSKKQNDSLHLTQKLNPATSSLTFSKTVFKSDDGRVTRTNSLKRIVNNKIAMTDQIVRKKLQLKGPDKEFQIIIRTYKAY